jgi:hypothetical protein
VLGSVLLFAVLSTSTVFSGDQPLRLGLDAPFNDLFDHAKDDTYSVIGTLTVTEEDRKTTVDGVRIVLRGNTSKLESECQFPKLKLDFPRDRDAALGPLAGLSSLKIGTHCGEETGDRLTQKFGRLANQRSPFREAFVYRLLAALDVPTLQARPAIITYRYTDARTGMSPPQDRPIVRNALLLEGADEGVRRVGGRREIEEGAFTNAQAAFRTSDTVRLAFAQALIGNFDWCLKMAPGDSYRCDARHPLWNILAADVGEGRAIPLMYDFDVAGIVSGRHPWFADVFNTAFVPGSSERDIEVMAQLQRTRVLFGRGDLDAARAAFGGRKGRAYEVLAAAALDEEGRNIARQYLDTFYTQIESDERFYRPVVIAEDAQAYETADGVPMCGRLGVVPRGTPASAPLQTDGARVQVMLLDALWHWTSPAKCSPVHRGPVWIDGDAIGRDFPAR